VVTGDGKQRAGTAVYNCFSIFSLKSRSHIVLNRAVPFSRLASEQEILHVCMALAK